MLNEGTCCLCLSEEETNFDIFTVIKSIPLHIMIESCIGVNLKTKLQSHTASLPNQSPVCNECVLNLNNFYIFKQKVLRAQSWIENVGETDDQSSTNQQNFQLKLNEDQSEYQIIQNENDDNSVLQIIVMQDEQEESNPVNEHQLVNFQEEEQAISNMPQSYAGTSKHSDNIRLTNRRSHKVSATRVSTIASPQKRSAEHDADTEPTKKGKTLMKNALKKVALQVNECIICPAVLSDILELANHTNTHDVLRCKVCYRGFQRFSNLKRHFLVSHSKPKPFVCDLCGLGFSFSVNLQAHAELHYSGIIKAKNKS